MSQSYRKPWWVQTTAVVGLGTSTITALALAQRAGAVAVPLPKNPGHFIELAKAGQPGSSSDSALRSAIVRAANLYLAAARNGTPAEIEAIIWADDTAAGTDHADPSGVFASLVLERGAQATGQQSWLTPAGTYPWPVHDWADVRADPDPAAAGITSVRQDAAAHHRWYPLGDGYVPRPGDWVLFDGRVEVVTGYADSVLSTIAAYSWPGLFIGSHEYAPPFDAYGMAGFVNNGELLSNVGQAAIPGLAAAIPAAAQASRPGGADIPGVSAPATIRATARARRPSPRYGRSRKVGPKLPGENAATETTAQLAFIDQVAPGAVAAQRQYGVPASVTIAQAIDESNWGRSKLAVEDHNLFGIEGVGPEGTVVLRTLAEQDGQTVPVNTAFRVYRNAAQSIADHGLLLATGPDYRRAMADRRSPDAFANDLTGVYATDPRYGADLIALMRLYDLYRFDAAQPRAMPVPPPLGNRPGSRRTRPDPGSVARRQQPPQPAKAAGAGWEQQPVVTMIVIPLLTNLVSSILYDRLKKALRRGKKTTFEFHIVKDDGNIIEARLETDSHEELKQAIDALAFHRIMRPAPRYEWDWLMQSWEPSPWPAG